MKPDLRDVSIQRVDHPDGTFDLTIRCPRGNPYTRSDESGMHCDASPCLCEQDDIAAEPALKALMALATKMFGDGK